MLQVSFDQLLQSGVHFGHLKKKWNPAMSQYIFMERNGIHVINLHKTIFKINEASCALKQMVKSGRKILFVATKKQAKQIVSEKATFAGMPHVTEHWFGGMLTNFQTFRKMIQKMSTTDKLIQGGMFDKLSKKEKLQISRKRVKLEKNLGSILNMKRLPSALFIVDVMKEHIAVKEAKRLKIPIFGIVDTNSDPSNIDFVIPANDDAANSIRVILDVLFEAIMEGKEERKSEIEKFSGKENAISSIKIKKDRIKLNKVSSVRIDNVKA